MFCLCGLRFRSVIHAVRIPAHACRLRQLGGHPVEVSTNPVLTSTNPYASVTPKFPTTSFPAMGVVRVDPPVDLSTGRGFAHTPLNPAAQVNTGLTRVLVLVNDGTNPTDSSNLYPSVVTAVTINVAAWNLPVGTYLVMSLVSAGVYGEVTNWPLQYTGTGNITFVVPAYSTSTVTAPTVPHIMTQIFPSSDTSVVAGVPLQSSPGAGNLQVCTSAAGVPNAIQTASTSVALVQFIVPQPSSSITMAVLELTVAVPPAMDMIMTVVGVAPTNATTGGLIWTEAGLTSWAQAQAFALTAPPPPGAPVTANFQQLGGGNVIVGHITVSAATPAGTTKRLDVSAYARSATVGPVTFVIARRLRNIAYVGNTAGAIPADSLSLGSVTTFFSKETGGPGQIPSLKLFTPAPLVPPSSLTVTAALSVAGYSSLSAAQQATIAGVMSDQLSVPPSNIVVSPPAAAPAGRRLAQQGGGVPLNVTIQARGGRGPTAPGPPARCAEHSQSVRRMSVLSVCCGRCTTRPTRGRRPSPPASPPASRSSRRARAPLSSAPRSRRLACRTRPPWRCRLSRR